MFLFVYSIVYCIINMIIYSHTLKILQTFYKCIKSNEERGKSQCHWLPHYSIFHSLSKCLYSLIAYIDPCWNSPDRVSQWLPRGCLGPKEERIGRLDRMRKLHHEGASPMMEAQRNYYSCCEFWPIHAPEYCDFQMGSGPLLMVYCQVFAKHILE